MAFRVAHAVAAGAMVAVVSVSVPAQDADGLLLRDARTLFAKLPADFGGRDRPLDPARVALGKTLFFDPRWSVDRNVSCASCHNPALYGADALARSIGVRGRHHARNAPSVLNIAGDVAANWRGELRDVEHQAMIAALGALSTGHTEHAGWTAQLKSIGGYAAMFQRAFPNDADPINPTNLSLAIGAYERILVTPAPFDSYLDGNVSALTPQARVGLRIFIDVGCAGCHNGAGVGGAMFRKFGVQADYWSATGSKDIDKGRFDVTRDEADLYVFKVPSLRNVARTAPYFHDGSAATLGEAIRIMARLQLGKSLADEEVRDIMTFLNSLTGDLPKEFSSMPTLPVNGTH